MRQIPNLEELIMNKTLISDSGWVHLKGLTNLKGLNLEYTKITDTGLKILSDRT